MTISRSVFDEQHLPRFGTANPERMDLEFWKWMIQPPEPAPSSEPWHAREFGMILRDGRMKFRDGPAKARDLFGLTSEQCSPIWTFYQRYGRTRTELPDGRIVYIGGEHEDYYDPDFCIYNDVIVLGPGEHIDIFGYPRHVFPPTDYHSASLIGRSIIVVGCLGYPEDRRHDVTPIHVLSLDDFSVKGVETHGVGPGWIHGHSAQRESSESLLVTGGVVFGIHRGEPGSYPNFDDYSLDTGSWVWRRLTERQGRVYRIRRTDGDYFGGDAWPLVENLLVGLGQDSVAERDEEAPAAIEVGGVSVSVSVQSAGVDIVVGDALPEALLDGIIKEIVRNTEQDTAVECTVELAYP